MAAGKKSSSEEIIDLTELIEKGGAEAPSASRKVQAQVHHDDDDIEALLADMDAGDVAPKSASGKVDANENLDMSNMGGIDDLLESLDIPPQPDSPSEAPTPLDNAVDDLMTNGNGKPKNNATPKQASFADDLDALLDEPEPKPAKKAQNKDDLDSALDDLFTSLNEKPGEPQKASKAAPSPVDDDLDDILSSIDEPAMPRSAPAKTVAKPSPADFPDDLDDLLNGTELPNPIPDEALAEREPEPAKPEPVKPAPKSKPVLQKLVNEAKNAENNLARDMLAQDPPAKSSGGDFNYAINANLENLNFQARDLGQRLQNCETDLAQTRLRLEGLEKSAANAASIEDLLRDGSSLHSGFAALIATSVGQVLQDTRENGPDLQVMNRFQTIETNSKSLEAALEALENRLANLEKHGEETSQVAEKIGDLVQNTNQSAERIESMENRLESIMPKLGNALQLADHYDELLHASARLDALENSFGELAGKADDSGLESGLKALEQETLSIKSSLEALENSFGEKTDSDPNDELQAKIEETAQQVEARLTDLESKITSLVSDDTGNDELVSRLNTVEQEALETKSRLESVETKFDAFSVNEANNKLEADIDEVKNIVSSRLDEFEGKLESLAGAKDIVQELTSRLDGIEQDAIAAKTNFEAVEARFDTFAAKEASDKLEANIDEVKNMASCRLDELESKLEIVAAAKDTTQELTTRLDDIQQDAVAAKTNLEAIEARFDTFTAKEDSDKLEANIDDLKNMASSRFDELESKLESVSAAKDLVLKLANRLDGIQNEAMGTKSGIEALEAKFDTFAAKEDSEKLEANIDEVRQMANARIDEIQDKLNIMEANRSEDKGLAERLDGIEQDALAAKNRLQAVEGQLDGMPQIENVETSLLAKVGSVEQETKTAKESIEVLEDRLGALESRKDTEASIESRLEDINAASQNASNRMDKLEEAISRLAEKEQADSSNQSHIDILEKAVGNRVDDLENKLAVLEEISQKTAAIMEQLQTLEKTSRSICFRIDAVESRLDNLEPRFNKEVEKAATSAVARVLREEISKLVADE